MRARTLEIVHDWAGTSDAPVIRQFRTDTTLYTLRGHTVYAEPIHMTPVAPPRLGLTKKEYRVAQLLAAGRSNEAIAHELFISPHTARHHTESVLRKLGIRSRREVAEKLSS